MLKFALLVGALLAPSIALAQSSDVRSSAGDAPRSFIAAEPAAGSLLSPTAGLDSDGDGVPDDLDSCPFDPNKTEPGICGCGHPDTDTDGDGTPDCIDACPNDPAKVNPGTCGCNVSDADSDGDGVSDCQDGCPNDGNKVARGVCGCGHPDTDTDGDGTPDCVDACPNDPAKVNPGTCGCNVSDADSDGDGVADCQDGCPNDGNKLARGTCGCGTPDTDTDGDGTPDCIDACPSDPNKVVVGICGCGVVDVDSDGDGTFDCNDGCPTDPNKTDPGTCGCLIPDDDSDADGIADCLDNCPQIANPGQEDCNLNGIGDVCDIASDLSFDLNANGIPDECEPGPGVAFCFGNGLGTPCPCGNNGLTGHGCVNSSGAGAQLYNAGGVSVGAGDTALYVSYLPDHKFGILYMGTSQPNGGNGIPFGDGLKCVGGFTKRFNVQSSGVSGHFTQLDPASSAPALILPGTTWFFQGWFRDEPGASPCGTNINLSNGLQLDFLP